jgi:pyruvate dehydrogenase E1 component alpha subunit
MSKESARAPHFFSSDPEKVIAELGATNLMHAIEQMLLIRNFEIRAESGYQQGKIGGFFHSYMGQEAIQAAAVSAIGKNQWWVTSYRCHALALLLGATPNELMAELYGKATGNARGRGGSMHFFTDKLLGGHGIVGGQIPIGTGAAFTAKYAKEVMGKTGAESGDVSVCFFGEGAVAQGSFHESLNLAAVWNLPVVFVCEDNQWAISVPKNKATSVPSVAVRAAGYGMPGVHVEHNDAVAVFEAAGPAIARARSGQGPTLIEVKTDRYFGHFQGDPESYRPKDEVASLRN